MPKDPQWVKGEVCERRETVRQGIVREITGTRRSSRQLAGIVGVSERQVEDHLSHIVKSVVRDRKRRFVIEPSACMDCGYIFRERTRLTKPSRCPRCRSEAITPPQFGIEVKGGVNIGS